MSPIESFNTSMLRYVKFGCFIFLYCLNDEVKKELIENFLDKKNIKKYFSFFISFILF